MANIRKYKNTEEARQAHNAQKQRYLDENTDLIRTRLPKGYKEKLEYITKEMNISRAQYIKNCIDTTYNELVGKGSLQQSNPEEFDT